MDKTVTKTFKYSFPTCSNEEVLFHLEVPVEIPYDGSSRELVQRVLNMFHIPVYLEDELNEKLAKFVTEETKNYHHDRDEKLINHLKNSQINIDMIVKNWEKQFKDNVLEFADQKGSSDEEVFAMAYHKLVHSPALETILQVEDSYAITVAEMLKSKDEDIKKLTESQTEEMEQQMRLLNTFTTEEDISDLASRQFESQALVAGRWGSQVDALWQAQRVEYRGWLMTLLCQSDPSPTTPTASPLAQFSERTFPPLPPQQPTPKLEDSFTIHLGSQLKQSHNLRLMCKSILTMTAPHRDNESEATSRLQTALDLYSSDLTGCVVVCDSLSELATSPAMSRVCRMATEYHFLPADAQCRNIRERLKEPLAEREAQRQRERSTGSESNPQSSRRGHCGDVLITKHSNLAEAHVLFHLVLDESVKSGEMNSRHPAILGLRNILKTCCCNDVTSVSLPLLLQHEASEEMTAAWCARRAELVLKCVKGFMLEAGSWGGADLRSIQFILPPSLSPEVFHNLASLLTSIFRTSNPLKFHKVTE